MASRRRERRKGSSQESADGNGAGSIDDSEDVQFDFPVESDPTPPATTSFSSQNGESADGDGTGPAEVSERPPIEEDPRLIPNVTAETPTETPPRPRIPRDPRSLRIDRERPKMPAGLRRLGRRSSGTIPPPPPPPTAFGNGSGGGSGKPRMKKLRFAFVLAGLTALAGVSTVFGMMMAVASDLPALEDFAQYRASKNTVVLDVTGGAHRNPLEQREQDPARVQPDLPARQERRRRNRRPALLRAPRRRLRGHRPRPRPGHPVPEREAGRFDDHPAVRQAGPRSPERANCLPEAEGGRARLPPRAPLDQGQDPHRVPEHHLLRPGRLRNRGRRPHLLRRPAPRLRHRVRPLRRGPAPRGGGTPRRDDLLARGL